MNKINLLPKDQLERLTTARLLAYKNKLMKVPETPDWHTEENNVPTQLNKTSPEWIETYEAIKEVLKTREHIE